MLSGEIRLKDGHLVLMKLEDMGEVDGKWHSRIILNGEELLSIAPSSCSNEERLGYALSGLEKRGVTRSAFWAWLNDAAARHKRERRELQ